jgi:hypothetical protein
VFVFAAGWRSGSTLLQRLITGGGDVLVWGEPYQHCQYVQILAESLRPMGTVGPPPFVHSPRAYLPFSAKEGRERISRIRSTFEARLYPHPVHLASAHREFFRTLYSQPARELGFSRWGFKEVRLEFEHAAYLKWLFGGARFIFLIRDPYRAYRSYRPFRNWYHRWPGEPIMTARQFGELWARLVRGYLYGWKSVDGMILRLEDLTSGEVPLARISEYLGCSIDEEALRIKVRGTIEHPEPGDVPANELKTLKKVVHPSATDLGYVTPL